MTTSELMAAFEADPSDHRAFEALLKHLVEERDLETLQQVFDRVPEWAGDDTMSPVFRVLSQVARTTTDDAMADVLYHGYGMVLWRHYGDAQKAEMAFRKLKAAPSDPGPLREFYLQFYVEQNNWRRLEQFLVDPTKGGMDDEVEVRRMLGRLAEEKGEPERAIVFWQGVRGALPDDDEAEAALTRLYEQVGKWHAMVDLLKEKLGRVPTGDVPAQIALHERMIAIYKDQLNAPTKVVGAWQAILDLDPGNRSALGALAAEYEEMKRWPDLVKVLQQTVEHEDDAAAKIALHRRIASIMLEKFSNSTEAIKHYEAILELDPSHRESIDVLRDIYEQRRDYDSYILVAQREIDLLEDPAERQGRYLELARLAAERIRKPATPIALWERVLEGDPAHAEALEQLEALYEREKDFEKLTDIQERRVDLLEDPAARAQLLEKLGLVYASRIEDEDRAAAVWKRLLEIDPEHRKAQAELKKKYLAERDWESLEWFFRTYGTLPEWVRTLESQAKSLDDDAERVELLFKAARLWMEELDDERRAVKSLESVLELAPRHAGAARMMVPIYRELGQWKKLPGVYDIVLEATEEGAARRALLLELAEVEEERLHDVDAAFFAYVQAVRETPGEVSLYADLYRLAEKSGNWETYVVVVEEAVDLLEDHGARVDALLSAGRVYRDHLEASDAALNAFTRVVEHDDRNRDALDAIEALYEAGGTWDQLIGVYDRKLRIARDADERKALLFKLARVWREELANNGEAEAIYREMLDDFPSDVAVHDALCAIYLDEGQHGPLLEVLERKRDVLAAEGAPAGVLADLECQLGMLAYGTRPDAEGIAAAVDRYEAALAHDPTHPQAIAGVEELLADGGQRLRIARILEPIYARRDDAVRLAEALEIQLVSAVEDDDHGTQVRLLERLAELYTGARADKDLAWRTYGRLFKLEPSRERVREAFEGLTEDLSRWDRLVALYTELADVPADAPTRLAIKGVVARSWHRRLGDLEQARVFYHKVLDEDPEHNEALDALEAIYVAIDRSEELLDIYRRKIDLSPEVDVKLDYLFRTSDLLRDRLERFDDAIASAREALDLAPGNLAAIGRLDELFTRTERWRDLATTLEDTLTHVQLDRERVAVLTVRLAAVHETRLDDVETGIHLYARVLEESPENAAAVAALERLFADAAHAPAIAPILQPVYDRAGDWQKLVDVYTVREGAADFVGDKVTWQYRIAALYETQGAEPQAAFDHYARAATLDPGNERTLGELLRLADVLGNHGAVIAHMQGLVGEIDDDRRRAETHRTIAALARDKTGDVETAEKHFRAILDIDPGDMGAIDDLVALYRAGGRTDRLVDTLLMKAPMVTDAEQQRDLYAEAGQLSAGELDNPERAIEIYETLHQLAPAQDVALDALEELYGRIGDWDRLVDCYRQKIDRAAELDERKRYAAMMGRVQADKQEAVDDAIHTWRTILEWDPSDLGALDELDALYVRQEDWYSLREALLKKQELVDEGGWITAQFRLAELFERDDRLANPFEAIRAYEALLERDPTHEASVERLKAIVADRDEREAAFAVLKPVLELHGDYEELWAQYEVIASHQGDDALKLIGTLHEMAELAERSLVDPHRAFGAYARAFEADPRHAPTLASLETLAEARGLTEELVALYGKGADEADDDFLALDLRLKCGALLMDRLGDADRAIGVYRAIREDHPEHPEALERLHQLYEGQGRADDLAEVLRHQADIAVDPEEKIRRLAKLAQVAEHQLGDEQAAYEAYVEILDLDRASDLAIDQLWRLYVEGVQRIDIAERLEPIYAEREAWDQLHALLELKLQAVEDRNDRLDILRQVAELNLDKLGRKADAIEWFGRAFRLEPDDDFLLDRLTTLADEADRWEDLHVVLMDGAEVSDDAGRKVELWHRAAAISRDRLADRREAERIYRLILEVDGDNYRALSALDALLVAGGRWADLEPVLAREAEVADFDDERIKLYSRLAELYRDELVRREDAIAAYRKVLDLNDMHRPALLALEALYRDDGRFEALYEVQQQLADTSRDDADRVSYLSAMARSAEVHLERPEKAVELWEEVLALAPDDRPAVHELQRLLEGQESWEPLVDAYDRELRMGVDDPARRLELYRRMGRTLQHRLDDGFRSQQWWQKAREEAPHDVEALEALRVIYRENYNYEGLAGVLEAQLDTGTYGEDAQLGLWRELAELRTESMPDPPRAIEAWRNVLRLSPGSMEAVEILERLYEQEERWPDAVELQRIRLEHVEDPEARVETWLHIARMEQERLADSHAAARTYRQILEEYPDNLEASQRLEAIYEGAQAWEELTEVLLARTDHLPDATDRLMNLQRLARVYENRLEQPDNAFLVLTRANEEVPDDFATLTELARLAQLSGLWEEMLEVYDKTLPHLDGDVALDVRLKAADLVRDRLREPAMAVGYYERALEADAENERALRALVDLQQDLGQWEPLVEALTRLADVTPDYGERIELLKRVARVHEEQRGDVEAAVAAWTAILDADELERDALDALERLHRDQQQWAALVDILERRARVEPERAVELNLRIGDLYEARLDRVADAIETYEEVLTYDPGNRTALDRLEALYGEREDWGKLIDVWERSFDSAHSDEDRVDLCRRIALLQREVFHDRDAAVDTYHRILGLAPGDEEALQALEDLHREGGNWEDLVQIYELKRAAATTPGERAEALAQQAAVYQDELGDVDNAIGAYERILHEVPDHAKALDTLEALYREQGLWVQVVDAIERKLAHESDPAARLALMARQGQVAADEIGNPDEAARHYNRALEEAPDWLPGLDALTELYERDERFDRVVETLNRKLGALEGDGHARSEVHVQLANVWRERLDNDEKALLHLEMAVEAEPESEAALWPLAEHYVAHEDWTKAMPLLDVLADRLERTGDAARGAEVHKQLGRCAEGLLDFDRALDEYRQAASVLQGDPEILRGLARLQFKRGQWVEAERAYTQLVEQHGDELSDEDFLEVHLRLGEAALKAGHIEAAKTWLSRVVERQPTNPEALRSITEVLEKHGDWEEAIAYKGRLVEIATDPLEQFTAQIAIGNICQDKLGDTARAAQAYEKALDYGEFSKEPVLQLVQIHAGARRYGEAVRWLNRLIEVEDDPGKKATYALSIAVMYRDELADVEQAVNYFNVVLDYDLGKLEAFRSIDELLTRQKDWKALEQNYRRMIQRAQSAGPEHPKAKALLFTLYKNLGEIYRSRLKNVEYAISAYELASSQRPKDEVIREILAGLYEVTEDQLDKAVEQHRTLIKAHPDRFDSYHRLFQVFRKMGAHDRAWCVAGLLCALDRADQEELKYYQHFVVPTLVEPPQNLDHNTWQRWIASPKEDPALGQIFHLLYQSLGRQLRLKQVKDFGLKKRDRLDTDEQTLVASTMKTASRILGIPLPEVYTDNRRMGFEVLPTAPPVLVVGPDMMAGQTEKQLAFRIAKRLTYFHPLRVMAALFEHEQLDLMFMAAAALVDPEFKLYLREDLPDETKRQLAERVFTIREQLDKEVTPQARKSLAQVMQDYWGRNQAPKIGTWHRHVELSANHAGLFLCGDIEMVGRILTKEVSGSSKLSRGDKLKDLVQYVLSERYADLRKKMGMTIDYTELLG